MTHLPRGVLGLLLFLILSGTESASAQTTALILSSEAEVTGQIAEVHLDLDVSGAPVEAYSFGVCTDSAQVTPLEVITGDSLAVFLGGTPPEFQSVNFYDGGITVGVLLVGPTNNTPIVPPFIGFELHCLTYDVIGEQPLVTPVAFCATLGTPPVPNVITQSSQSTFPLLIDGEIEILPPDDFRRGDTNNDGTVGLSDTVYGLNFIFSNGPDVACLDALDISDNGTVGVNDIIQLLSYLILMGPEPTTPGINCGQDPTDDLFDPCADNACP